MLLSVSSSGLYPRAGRQERPARTRGARLTVAMPASARVSDCCIHCLPTPRFPRSPPLDGTQRRGAASRTEPLASVGWSRLGRRPGAGAWRDAIGVQAGARGTIRPRSRDGPQAVGLAHDMGSSTCSASAPTSLLTAEWPRSRSSRIMLRGFKSVAASRTTRSAWSRWPASRKT